MRNTTPLSCDAFKDSFNQLLPAGVIGRVLQQCRVKRRRPPLIAPHGLVQGLVFHVVAGSGTLARHMTKITGQAITDGALS
jgi:hypothetical protein